MSSIFRIKENMGEYTENEKKIAQYILKNKNVVVSSSAQEISTAIGTSAAALVRFAKRVGYTGFTQLKVELAKDHSDDEEEFDSIIKDTDDFKSLVKKTEYANRRTFKNTYRLLNFSLLEKAIQKVIKANRIYLFGIGGSGLICEDLFQKFIRIDVPVTYHKDFHLQIASLAHAKKGDIAISFSYSGDTKEIISAQKLAKEKDLTTIAITQVGRTKLDRYSDYVFHVPKEEAELRLGSISSRFSMLAFSDIIYLGVAQNNIKDVRSKIIDTKNTVNEFAK